MYLVKLLLSLVCLYISNAQVSINFEELNHVLYNLNIEQQPILASTSVMQSMPSATSEDYEELVLVSRFGQSFRCSLPSSGFFDKRAINHSVVSSNVSEEESQRLSATIDKFTSLPCLRATQDWWTYELCHKRFIKQFHLTGGKVDGETTFLGHFEQEKNWTTLKRERHLKDNAHAFYAHTYAGGSSCDLTGRPRSAEVRYLCDPESAAQYAMKSVSEPESCTYVITVHARALCNSSMRPQSTSAKEQISIRCWPVVDEVAYERFEQQQAALTAAKQQKAAADPASAEPTQTDGLKSEVSDGDALIKSLIGIETGEGKGEAAASSEASDSKMQYSDTDSDYLWTDADLEELAVVDSMDEIDDADEFILVDEDDEALLNSDEFEIFDVDVVIDVDENGKPVLRTILRAADEESEETTSESDGTEGKTQAHKTSKSKRRVKKTADSTKSIEPSAADDYNSGEGERTSAGSSNKVLGQKQNRQSKQKLNGNVKTSSSEELQANSKEQSLGSRDTRASVKGRKVDLASSAGEFEKSNDAVAEDAELDELDLMLKRVENKLAAMAKAKAKPKFADVVDETVSPAESKRESTETDVVTSSKSLRYEEDAAETGTTDAKRGVQPESRPVAAKQKSSNSDVDDVVKLATETIRKMLKEKMERSQYATKKDFENLDLRFVEGHRRPDEEVTPAEQPNAQNENGMDAEDGTILRQFGSNLFFIEVPADAELQQRRKERELKKQTVELQRQYNRLWNDDL